MKPIVFIGDALDSLRRFPLDARRQAGYQLDKVQKGGEPSDWKPIASVGAGVREVRIRDAAGAFRVIYVATFADTVFVLHCFQKKTEKTRKLDLELAVRRYQQLRRDQER